MKNRFNSRARPSFYFFRNCNGNEVDLIIEQSGHTVAFEIKSAKPINDSFFKGLNYYRALSNRKVKSYCLYGGEEQFIYKGHQVLGWNQLAKIPFK